MESRPVVLLSSDPGAARVVSRSLAAALGRPMADPGAGATGMTAAGPGPVVVIDLDDGGRPDPAPLVSWLDADPVVVWLQGVDGGAGPRRGEPPVFPTVAADLLVAGLHRSAPDALAARIASDLVGVGPRQRTLTEHVELGPDRRYPVVVGRGAAAELASLLPAGVRRVAVVTQAGIGLTVDPGVEHQVFTVEDGEGAKRLEVVGDLASRFARWGLTRRDAVVSVGGGVVSDLAGFVAATYHRGIGVVHVSTTLLGQIDASVGGKCGVNLPEGKNLLGAFKQPAAVICDIDALATLPAGELACGMGELAKYHFLGGGDLDRLPLPERVAACVRLKADVVAADETEGGVRATLNYGHTLAHALEIATGHRLRHGEAVAIGLLYAAELARALGRIDDARVAEHRRVVDVYGLRRTIPDGLDPDELIALFTRDKKAVDGITFVLDGPRGVEPVPVDDLDLLRATLETVA